MDARQLLAKLTSSPGATGLAGGLVGGGLVAALVSKTGPKTLGTAAQVGGLAALGGLAYQAWRRYQQNQQPVAEAGARPPPAFETVRERFVPPADNVNEKERLSRNVLQAMVTAAKADGSIDDDEWQRIDQRVVELGLDANERGLLVNWMREPADPARIAGLARNIEEAAELYLASLFAIDVDHWTEQAYIERLRMQLDLDPQLAAELEKTAASGMAPAAA